MVPWGGWMAFSQASASNSSLAWGNISLISRSTAALRCSLGGASKPGPQLVWPAGSRSDFFQVSHWMRDSSVRRLSSWKPMSLAKRSAPSPTSIMWSVCSMTMRATLEGVLILRRAPTAPPRREGPCMQLESSSTTPSSFGNPPYPTLLSRGSSSTMLTPAMTASSVSPPAFMISMALAQQLTPPLLRLALETTTGGLACAAALRTMGSAAAPRIAARLVNVMIFIMSRKGLQLKADSYQDLHLVLIAAAEVRRYPAGVADLG